MEADATAVANQKPKAPHLYGKGQSGNRRGRVNVRARAAEVFDSLRPDFGELNATDTLILKQAAMMVARSESISSVRHADAAIRLSSESRRLLLMLKRHAPKRDSELRLEDYLREDAIAEAQATRATAEANECTGDDDKGAAKPMALDAALPKTDAELSDLDDDVARVCRGEVL